jgi:acid phosphatase
MQPVLNAIVQRLTDGPNKTYVNNNGQSWTPGPFIPMFTNDGQINQLAAEIGVFDQQKPLPNNKIPNDQVTLASGFIWSDPANINNSDSSISQAITCPCVVPSVSSA